MAKSLIVRNVEEDLIRRLKLRAARHNRSMEAEHREILRTSLAGEVEPSFGELAARARAATRGRAQTAAEDLVREGRDER